MNSQTDFQHIGAWANEKKTKAPSRDPILPREPVPQESVSSLIKNDRTDKPMLNASLRQKTTPWSAATMGRNDI